MRVDWPGCLSAANDPDQHNDNGNNQQEMNKSSHRVIAHQSEHPENHHYYCNGPQHMPLLYVSLPAGTYIVNIITSRFRRQTT